jgi:diguanylate cyclase (GGDEF)-like protein/PAS domain S-box-containing protein
MNKPLGSISGTPPSRVLLIAAGSFCAVTLLRFAVGEDALDGLGLLYVLPIAYVAIQFGPVAGAISSVAGFGLFTAWTVVDDVDVPTGGYVTRGLVFVLIGVGSGWLALRRADEEARSTRWFEMSNDMLCEASLEGTFTRLNGTWEACLGWTPEELMSQPYAELVHPDDLQATLDVAGGLADSASAVVNFENRFRAKDGTWRWLLWSSRSDRDRLYAVAKDITDRKHLEAEREQLLVHSEAVARTDVLTGLPNRRAWDEELRRELARSQRYNYTLAVAIIDLDRFKAFNDAHGHPTGDELLRDAATAWRLTLRVSDFIARTGGEEFGVLLPQCPAGPAHEIIERVRACTPRGQTCSAGIATFEADETPESLVARADAALYEAKRLGRDQSAVADAVVR